MFFFFGPHLHELHGFLWWLYTECRIALMKVNVNLCVSVMIILLIPFESKFLLAVIYILWCNVSPYGNCTLDLPLLGQPVMVKPSVAEKNPVQSTTAVAGAWAYMFLFRRGQKAVCWETALQHYWSWSSSGNRLLFGLIP